MSLSFGKSLRSIIIIIYIIILLGIIALPNNNEEDPNIEERANSIR